jgi:long-subunit acyl-CoA synthetase (AMP-forming)
MTPMAGPLAVNSLCEAFQNTVAGGPDDIALRTPGGSQEITWGEYGERVRRIATGLAGLGVTPGDSVAIMMVNRPEFNLVDTAVLHLGATPFSVYNTSSPEQLQYLLSDAGATVVVAEAQFVERVKDSGVGLSHIVCLEQGTKGTTSLADLEQAEVEGFDFKASWQAVGPEDLATLIYTSGTTGPPKGVELTHGGIIAQLVMTTSMLPVERSDRGVSYLPSAHIADRWLTHYSGLVFGASTTSVADTRTLAAVLPEVRPTIWGAVPRVWEKFMTALEAAGVADPTKLPPEMKVGVLAKLGLDQVRWSVSGAAPIPPAVLEYFGRLGLPICELWGMSELSCCATINPPDDIRVGTVGKALPGVELKLAEDSELLVRAETVMRGYRNNPEKTAEVIDEDGWLITGDIATIDEDGYVKIVDRKKELIISASGKNMSPANIEQTLKASSPLIGVAVCIGDRRPYNVALLVLDPDFSAAYAAEAGLADASPHALAKNALLLAQIDEAVHAANSRLSRVEQVKKYTVLPIDWEPGGDELTPTMKLKRKPISEKYATEIEALYASE